MTHRMIFNQTGYFGRGAITHIAPEITRRGLTKAFIVTDPVLADNGTAARITDLLDEAGISWEVFSDVAPNPPIEKVQAGLAAFRASGADVLIGLGGGSPQDTCKAISVIATNPDFEDVLSLEGLSPTTRPGVPIIGVPTTAGTASETTINYVITDTAKQRKFVCVDPHDIPVLAIVDPDLMDGMPRSLKVATGLDALTHAIEGYITPGAWELSDALCLRSIQMIAANLRAQGQPVLLHNIMTRGLLAVMSKAGTISDLGGLAEKNLVMPFKNDMPDIVLQILAKKHGINLENRITYTATPPEAVTLFLQKDYPNALLPEPLASASILKGKQEGVNVERSFSLDKIWSETFNTAKGGILFAISEKLGIPIRYIGVGEQPEDLRPFNAQEFVQALLYAE